VSAKAQGRPLSWALFCCVREEGAPKMQPHFIEVKSVKPRPPARTPRKSKPPKTKMQEPEYGPTFFLTADSDTAPAFEIYGTPHPITIQCYRLGNADIREFEEQDGNILYKIRPRKPLVG
jgi:hypothetical protein